MAVRFVLRMSILGVFASIGSHGFCHTFASLLTLAAIFCMTLGLLRREPIFGANLTNWDEAAAYLLIGRVASLYI